MTCAIADGITNLWILDCNSRQIQTIPNLPGQAPLALCIGTDERPVSLSRANRSIKLIY